MTQACLVFLNALPVSAAATAANTAIVNTATASYSDINATSYSASMTYTIYVQNAPTFTVVSPSSKNVTVGDHVIDTFSLQNTGNGSGNFLLAADATATGTGGASTLLGYVLNDATSGTCNKTTPCTLATLQGLLAAGATTAAPNDPALTIGVAYTVTSTTYGGTILYSIAPAISYAAQSNAAQVSSATSTSTAFTDTIVTDARLDIKVVSTPAPNASAPLAWVVTANNGGGYPAHDSASQASLIGNGPGVAFFIKVPVYGGAALALAAQPTAPTVSGTTATLYYSNMAVGSPPGGSTDWNAAYTNATWIAIVLSGGTGGNELASAPGGSSGAGNVSTPQVSFTFTTAQPASSSLNSVKLVTNSVIDGNIWDNGIYPMIGPTIASGTADGGALGALEMNATPGDASGAWPGGASNEADNQAYGMSVVNGPLALPGATGSYPGPTNLGVAAATNSLDFTALGFICANGTGIFGGGANCSVPTGGIQIPNTVQNSGNLSDTITISVTPPTGWTAQIFTATCAAPVTVVPTCTSPVSIGGPSAAGTLVTSSGITLAANATQDYVVQYKNASSVTPFTGVDALVTANGTGDTNDTHNDLYPGGVISIGTASTTTSNCPVGGTTSNICPGGLIKYVTTYANVAPAGSVVANVGSEPSYAYAALMVGSGGLTITSDGTSGGWASNTFGLNGTGVTGSAVPVASDGVVTAYLGASVSTAWATGTYQAGGTGISNGPNKLVAAIASTSTTVAPGGTGTITYYVTVK